MVTLANAKGFTPGGRRDGDDPPCLQEWSSRTGSRCTVGLARKGARPHSSRGWEQPPTTVEARRLSRTSGRPRALRTSPAAGSAIDEPAACLSPGEFARAVAPAGPLHHARRVASRLATSPLRPRRRIPQPLHGACIRHTPTTREKLRPPAKTTHCRLGAPQQAAQVHPGRTRRWGTIRG